MISNLVQDNFIKEIYNFIKDIYLLPFGEEISS